MKDIKELNPHDYETNKIIDENLQTLFDRVIELQDAYGKEFIVTSGLRSDEKQAELIKQGKSTARLSNHLFGCAVDVLDSDGQIAEWVMLNLDACKRIGLWMESFESIEKLALKYGTRRWAHFQIKPPKSGNRVFIP